MGHGRERRDVGEASVCGPGRLELLEGGAGISPAQLQAGEVEVRARGQPGSRGGAKEPVVGFVEAVEGQGGQGSTEVEARVVGVTREGGAEGALGVVPTALLQGQETQLGIHAGVAGVAFERLLVAAEGLLGPPEAVEPVPAEEELVRRHVLGGVPLPRRARELGLLGWSPLQLDEEAAALVVDGEVEVVDPHPDLHRDLDGERTVGGDGGHGRAQLPVPAGVAQDDLHVLEDARRVHPGKGLALPKPRVDGEVRVRVVEAPGVAHGKPVVMGPAHLVGLEPVVVGLVVREGPGLGLEVGPPSLREDVLPDPPGGPRSPGPQLLAGHQAVVGHVYRPPLSAMVIGPEPVVGALVGEEAAGVLDVLPPAEVDAVVDRPVPELRLPVAGDDVAGVLGLGPLVGVGGGGGPELEGHPVVRGVDEDVVAADAAPSGLEGHAHQPAGVVDGLGLPHPHRGAAVVVTHDAVVHRHVARRAVPVGEVPLDPAGDPGSGHGDEAGLDRPLPVEPDVVVGLVHRPVEPAPDLREDQYLDVLVLEDDRVVLAIDSAVGERFLERVRVDAALGPRVQGVHRRGPDLPGRQDELLLARRDGIGGRGHRRAHRQEDRGAGLQRRHDEKEDQDHRGYCMALESP